MRDYEFEQLVTEALILLAQQTVDAIPPDDQLDEMFPDTSALDERIRQIKNRVGERAAPKKVPLRKRMARYAAMFFLTLSLLLGAAMLHPDARAYIVNLVVTWYEDHVRYSFREDNAAEIPADWVFGYIPEGFVLTFEEDRGTDQVFCFENDDGALLDISISNESSTYYMDNEHFTITHIVLRGTMADVYEGTNDESPNMIVWHREDMKVMVSIFGDMPIEKIILIAEGMSP